jgi:hypothetical protein
MAFLMKKKGEIALSTKGLKLFDGLNRRDFTIVSGSDSFVCDRFQAAFISPRILKMLLNDATIDMISFSHTDSGSFEFLDEMIRGNSIFVNEDNICLMTSLIEDLENPELSELVFKFIDEWNPLNHENCISRLKQKHRHCLDRSKETRFISSHFSELNEEKIFNVEIELMKDILSQDTLQILNEDWLLEKILHHDPIYFELIGCVQFKYLTTSSIDLFFNHVRFEDINHDIWHQLWHRSRHRLIYSSSDLSLNRFKNCISRFPQSSSSFSGLICHLCSECFGNVHEKGLVNITCSSSQHNNCWQLVNYDWNDYFYTKNESNSWIQFDFKDRLVSVTHYALKSDGHFCGHLLEWILSGSNDGNSWTIVDSRKTEELNGKYLTKLFECDTKSSVVQFYRYIRLTQTGKNSSGRDFLQLGNIEFFGSIVKPMKGGFMIEALSVSV